MLFADWALGLPHSIRAIEGHCSTGGKKTCFVGILLHTQSVHTDSQIHTWHTQTPRPIDTQTHRQTRTLTQRHVNHLVAERKVSNFVSHIFLKIYQIFHEIWSQRQSPHPSEPLATISSVSDWVRATMVIIILTFHHIPFIALALNYAVKFALKNTLFSSWRQNMNNRILEVHQIHYIIVR